MSAGKQVQGGQQDPLEFHMLQRASDAISDYLVLSLHSKCGIDKIASGGSSSGGQKSQMTCDWKRVKLANLILIPGLGEICRQT